MAYPISKPLLKYTLLNAATTWLVGTMNIESLIQRFDNDGQEKNRPRPMDESIKGEEPGPLGSYLRVYA